MAYPRWVGGTGGLPAPPNLPRLKGRNRVFGPREVRGYEDPVRVYREMREAAAVAEERFAGVAVVPVLQDRPLDVLTGERVLEFGSVEGDAVQEESHVDALLRLGAVPELADDGEEICGVEPPCLLVEAARRTEVSELELAARVLDALSEDVQSATPFELPGEAAQEALADIGAVVLLEAVPGALAGWLRGNR